MFLSLRLESAFRCGSGYRASSTFFPEIYHRPHSETMRRVSAHFRSFNRYLRYFLFGTNWKPLCTTLYVGSSADTCWLYLHCSPSTV